METLSALLARWEGNPWIIPWLSLTKATDVELSFYLDLCPKKWLSKQWRCQWFDTPSRSLWHHCNDLMRHLYKAGYVLVCLEPCNIQRICSQQLCTILDYYIITNLVYVGIFSTLMYSKFFRRHSYLHFALSHQSEMAKVIEILYLGRQGPSCIT